MIFASRIYSTTTTTQTYNLTSGTKLLGDVVGKTTTLLSPEALTAKDPTTMLQAALAQNVASNITQNLLGMTLDEARSLGGVSYMVDFFANLPANIVQSQSSWEYNSAQLLIENKKKSSIMSQMSDIFSSSEDTSANKFIPITSLKCDLQFKGHGDISSPIGFKIVNDKYYFTPGTNLFSVQTARDGATQVKNLLSDSLKSTFNKLVGLMKIQKMSEAAQMITTFFNRAAILYPQDIFVFKLVQLFNSASRNSAQGASYPRLAHIPMELMLLMKRLMITPNYKATMDNHGGSVKFAYDWNKSKIIYFESPYQALQQSIFGVSSTVLNAITSSIDLSVAEDDWNDYQASLRGLSEDLNLKKNINLVWSTDGYLKRSDLILNKLLLENNFVGYSKREQRLFLSSIAYHVFCRTKGFLAYNDLYKEIQAKNASGTTTNATNVLGTSSLNLELIIKALNSRIPKVVAILKKTLDVLNLFTTTNAYVEAAKSYFQNQLTLVEQQKKDYTEQINNLLDLQSQIASPNLSETEKSNILLSFSRAATAFSTALANDEAANYPDLAASSDSGKRTIGFENFMNMKFRDVRIASVQPFRGDSGYVKLPLPMNSKEAVDRMIAIVLRLIDDATRAENLFKVDATVYKMIDVDGSPVDVQGTVLYEQTVQQSQKLAISLEKQSLDLKNAALNTGILASTAQLEATTKKVNDAQATLNTRWKNFLCQYHFDRRRKDSLIDQALQAPLVSVSQAASSVNSTVQGWIVSESDMLKSDAQVFIRNESLFGPSVVFFYAKSMALNLLEYLSNTLKKDSNLLAFKNNELASVQKNLQLVQAAKNDPNALPSAEESALAAQVKNLSAQIENISTSVPDWIVQATNKIKNLQSSGNAVSNLKNASQNPIELAEAFMSLAGINISVLDNIESMCADIDQSSAVGYEKYVTVLDSKNNFSVLVANKKVEAQQTTYFDSFNQSMKDQEYFSFISTRFAKLESISSLDLLNKVLKTPVGLDISDQDLANLKIAPAVTSNSSVSTTQSTSTPVTGSANQTAFIQASGRFASIATDYPDSIYSFLFEELFNLVSSSEVGDFIPLYLDPIMIALVGCNYATFAANFSFTGKASASADLLELLSTSVELSGEIAVSQILIDKIKSQMMISTELSKISDQMVADLNALPATGSSPSTEVNISSAAGSAMDQAVGVSVVVKTDATTVQNASNSVSADATSTTTTS